jgi:hypothetical protein
MRVPPITLCYCDAQARAKANEIVGEHAAPVILQFDTAATATADTSKATTGSKDVSISTTTTSSYISV